MGNLARFGVSLDQDLLEPFDELCRRKSYPNRSEAIRDLIRKALVEEKWNSDAHGAGIERLRQRRLHARQAIEARVGVLRIGRAVEQHRRIVVERAGGGDVRRPEGRGA